MKYYTFKFWHIFKCLCFFSDFVQCHFLNTPLCFILLFRYYYKKIVLSTKKYNFFKKFLQKIKNDHFKPFFNKNSYILTTLFNMWNYTKNTKNGFVQPFLLFYFKRFDVLHIKNNSIVFIANINKNFVIRKIDVCNILVIIEFVVVKKYLY